MTDHVKAVKDYLEDDNNSGWLLVYDNCDREYVPKKYLPSRGGKIIINGRDVKPRSCFLAQLTLR